MTVTPHDHVEFVELPGRTSADPLRSIAAQSSMRIARPENMESRNAHRHPHSEEVIYVRHGAGVIYIDGVTQSIAAGDTVHIPQGAAHATIPDDGADMELICFFPHPDLSNNIEETDIDVMKEIDDE